jgi:hypothetical protein
MFTQKELFDSETRPTGDKHSSLSRIFVNYVLIITLSPALPGPNVNKTFL